MKKFLGILIVLVSLSPLHAAIQFRTGLSASLLTGFSFVPEVDFGNFAVGGSIGYVFFESEKSSSGPSFGFFMGYTDLPEDGKGIYNDLGLELIHTPIDLIQTSLNLYFKCGYSFSNMLRTGMVCRLPIIPNIGNDYNFWASLGQGFLTLLMGVGVEITLTF